MLLLLANLLIRSALILATAALVRRFLPTARQRHALLLFAFVLLLVWPLFASLLPEFDLPLAFHPNSQATVTVQAFVLGSRPVASQYSSASWPLLVWGSVAAATLLYFLAGYVRLAVLARRALPAEGSWASVAAKLSNAFNIKTPRILVHAGPLPPLTFGLVHPCVLLPADCESWSPDRRRIVLLHEFAHIARRDLLAQVSARLIAAVWWFQPLCWTTLRLLRRESEKACDAAVVALGVRPSDYAAELLSIARNCAATPLGNAGIAMARPGDLENRLAALLAPVRKSSTRRAMFIAVVALTCVTLAASAINPLPASQSHLTKGLTMKRSLFAGMLSAAGLTAATLGGSLFDPSGAAVPGAKALLYDPDTTAKFETVTGGDGKFTFESLPAGQYILRVQKPGFTTLFREFNLKNDAKVERGLTLALGSVKENVEVTAQGTPAAARPTKPTQPLRVGGEVAQANLTTKVQPVYPVAAKQAGIQGTVTLETVISKDGEPLDIRVVSSPSDDLTQSSLEAVRQWRYRPTLLNGNPVEIVTQVVVNYTLSK